MKRLYFLIGVLILLPITLAGRIWQLTTAIDADGFFNPEFERICSILGIVLLCVVGLLLLAARLLMRDADGIAPPKRNPAAGAAALALAACCVPQILLDRGQIGNAASFAAVILPTIVLAVSFAVIAGCQFSGRSIPFVVTLLPTLAEFVCFFVSYSDYNGISHISENLIHILFLCGFVGFLLAHTRVYSGVESARGVKWLFGTGAATVIFGFCAFLPAIFGTASQRNLAALGLGGGIYALVFLWVMALRRQTQPAVPSESEEIE